MTPHIDWNTIITATVGALILTAIRYAWSSLKKVFTKHEKRTTLLEIKFECMNAGFENVNHGWGDQYKEGYERKRKELFQQQEFLEDE